MSCEAKYLNPKLRYVWLILMTFDAKKGEGQALAS